MITLEPIKDNATLLLAIFLVMATFIYTLLNPTTEIPALMERWGDIALVFFFSVGSTAMGYRLCRAQ